MKSDRGAIPALRPAPGNVRGLLLALMFCVALLAAALQVPGHVSMDTSMQLYEAHTGSSVSWSPPFMSAALRWMGGGTQATTLFVLACVAMTYGGMALAFPGVAVAETTSRGRRVVGALLLVLAILNPMIFLYVGIVWKDVLFASLFATAAGLLLHATAYAGSARGRWLYFIAGLILVPMLLVRQQGVVLAPPLFLACLLGVAGAWQGWFARRWWLRFFLVLLVYGAAYWQLERASQLTIADADGRTGASGYTFIRKYDITGLVASGAARGVALPGRLSSDEFQAGVLRAYGDDRIDHVMNDPAVIAGFRGVDPTEISTVWSTLVAARPDAYVSMKARQYAWLLGLHRLDHCLPIHLGVEGKLDYLAAVGVPPRMDERDRLLFGISLQARHLATHRHWFYLLLLFAAAAWLVARRKSFSSAERQAVSALIAGLTLFYASFMVAGLACDFRYLYPGLIGVTVLFVFLVAHECLRGRKTDSG